MTPERMTMLERNNHLLLSLRACLSVITLLTTIVTHKCLQEASFSLHDLLKTSPQLLVIHIAQICHFWSFPGVWFLCRRRGGGGNHFEGIWLGDEIRALLWYVKIGEVRTSTLFHPNNELDYLRGCVCRRETAQKIWTPSDIASIDQNSEWLDESRIFEKQR